MTHVKKEHLNKECVIKLLQEMSDQMNAINCWFHHNDTEDRTYWRQGGEAWDNMYRIRKALEGSD